MIANGDVRGYFRELGVELPAGAGQNVSISCPFDPDAHQHGDRQKSCSINVDSGVYQCFGCAAKGGPYDAALALGMTPSRTMELLERHWLAERRAAAPQVRRRRHIQSGPTRPARGADESWRAALFEHPTLLDDLRELRGWTPAGIELAGVGFDPDDRQRPIVFPVHDAQCQLVGVSHYQPDPSRRNDGPKMKARAGTPREPFPPPERISGEELWVVEGEPDAVSLATLGLPGVALPGASKRNAQWWRRLATGRRRVNLLPDCDSRGRSLMREAAEAITAMAVEVRILDLDPLRDDGHDVGDLLREAAQEGDQGLVALRALLGTLADTVEPVSHTVSPAATTRDLPAIEVAGQPLRDVTADAVAALTVANEPARLFVRSARLARVRFDEHGRPMIESVGEAPLRGALARAGNFVRTGSKGSTPIAPPLEVVRDVQALDTWPFPPLEAVIEAPAIRENGTIIDAPGYDPQSRLFYAPAPGLCLTTIPAAPTDRQRSSASALLTEALEGFPFVDQASRANALALMLTPILRPAIAGQVPLALIDATKAGTGKGLLAGLAATATTGRPAAVIATPQREEEWAKTILAVLMRGSTFILLDEAAELRSPSLAAALTASTFEGRILSLSETAQVCQRATWAAAGNNIRLGGDLARRCYWIRLDAKTARPWKRTGFLHPDLLEWAGTRRADLLTALLTLARGWFSAGQPRSQIPALGGFSEWANTVGSVLAHAGVLGFLDNLEELYDLADEEAVGWETFLRTWRKRYGATPVTVAQLTKAVDDGGTLRDALPEELELALAKSSVSFRAKLGRALGKRSGTRFGADGLRIERVGQDGRSAVTNWRVAIDNSLANEENGFLEPNVSAEVAEVRGPIATRTREADHKTHTGRAPQTSATSATSAPSAASDNLESRR